MTRLFLTGILTAALVGIVYAQPQAGGSQGTSGSGQSATSGQAGQTGQTTSGQPATKGTKAGASTKAAAGNNLASIRLPKRVTANGQPLAAGTYQVRLTDETAKPVTGETPESERWVEFVQGATVKGKELASVVPDTEIAQVAEGPGKPAKNGHRVDLLKTQKYWRVWINKGGNNYLIHLPPAEGGKTGTAAAK